MELVKLFLAITFISFSQISFSQNADSLRKMMLEYMDKNQQSSQKKLTDSQTNAMVEYIVSIDKNNQDIYTFKGKQLPEFELALLNGGKLHSDSLKGKPTVINFWFSRCQPCIDEMPLFNKIKSDFGDQVNFIAITFENQNEVNEFLTQYDFDFTHLIDSRPYLENFGRFGYPKTLIADKNLIITEIEKGIPKDTAKQAENEARFIRRISDQLIELLD